LSDHYDPRAKTLRLSQQVYFAPSVAAAGIAAHEAGHALQDAEDYFPLEARTYIVPIVQIVSQVAPWLFVVGLLLQLETPDLGWSHPIWVVLPPRHPHIASPTDPTRTLRGIRPCLRSL
jgi:Zn-dependent membrane protease YugP